MSAFGPFAPFDQRTVLLALDVKRRAKALGVRINGRPWRHEADGMWRSRFLSRDEWQTIAVYIDHVEAGRAWPGELPVGVKGRRTRRRANG